MKFPNKRLQRNHEQYRLVTIPVAVAALPEWQAADFVAIEYNEQTRTLSLKPVGES